MGKFAKELIESMQQAAKHAADKRVRGLRLSKVEVPDVKAIRLSLHDALPISLPAFERPSFLPP